MAEQQKKKWLEEKEEMEAKRIAKEEQRRDMIFKKRQKEREELNHRLDIARNNFTIAQENLKKVLEKNDSKSEHFKFKSNNCSTLKVSLKLVLQNLKIDDICSYYFRICIKKVKGQRKRLKGKMSSKLLMSCR